jgi:threonine dehydratase
MLRNFSKRNLEVVYNRINDLVKFTPLQKNARLSKKYNANIFLKREDLQIPRSFKIRGAYYKILKIHDKINSNTEIVCASAGNHAQGVALSCSHLDLPCTIFIPNNTPLQKINRIKHFSNSKCNIELFGDTFDQCLEEANKYAVKNNNMFIHPFNDHDVIMGQSTIAYEIFSEITPNYIVAGVGGGGLIAGISLFNTQQKYNCKIIGSEPETCPSMKLSIENNKIINYPATDIFVDGATVNQVGDITYKIVKKNVDKIYSVPIGKLCEDIMDLYTEDGIISEPAGALPISTLDQMDIQGKDVVCILSGGNNDISRYPDIRDRLLIYKGLKQYYIIQFTQKSGELKSFINNIMGPNDDIVRFEYIKKTNTAFGNVLLGVELENHANSIIIENNFNNFNINYLKIDDNHILYKYLI